MGISTSAGELGKLKKRNPLFQDTSGHVTMTSDMNGFFRDSIKKQHTLDLKRQYGLMQHKPPRNPLKAEKSPRPDYSGFSFDVPQAIPSKERWVYPDDGEDWGLMLKFSTQKNFYEKIMASQKNLQNLEKQQESNLGTKIEKSVLIPKVEIIESLKPTLSSQNELQMSSSTRKLSESRCDVAPKKSVADQKISTIKTLQVAAPEVLSNWRAQRAVAYISSLKEPLDEPTINDNFDRKPFRPSGTVPPDKFTKIVEETRKNIKPKDPSLELKKQLVAAELQLASTERDIAEQERKIEENRKLRK